MIEAKDAQEAFTRLRFTLRSADSDIRLVSEYLTQQQQRESREGTPTAYLNREQEVAARINKMMNPTRNDQPC